MKKKYLCTAALLATSCIYGQLYQKELSPGQSSSITQQPILTSTGALQILGTFRSALKENNATGIMILKSPSGNVLASFTELGEVPSGELLSFATVPHNKKMELAGVKADSSLYFGLESGKIPEKELELHAAALQGSRFTNMPGGALLKCNNGSILGAVGVVAYNAGGTDVSGQIAKKLSQCTAAQNALGSGGSLMK